MRLTCRSCGWKTDKPGLVHPTSLVTCPKCGSHTIEGIERGVITI